MRCIAHCCIMGMGNSLENTTYKPWHLVEMADKMLKTVKARYILYVSLSALSYHRHMIYFFFLLHTLGLITIPALTGTWLLTDSITHHSLNHCSITSEGFIIIMDAVQENPHVEEIKYAPLPHTTIIPHFHSNVTSSMIIPLVH